MKRFLITTCVVLASFGITAGAALADSCDNTSRAAPNVTGPGPIVKGNWVWLPSIGVPVESWGFAPPGTIESTLFGFPGANGNYTNGQTSSLLGVSARMTPSVSLPRWQSRGFEHGCAARRGFT